MANFTGRYVCARRLGPSLTDVNRADEQTGLCPEGLITCGLDSILSPANRWCVLSEDFCPYVDFKFISDVTQTPKNYSLI